jgi:hypothetical protein
MYNIACVSSLLRYNQDCLSMQLSSIRSTDITWRVLRGAAPGEPLLVTEGLLWAD